ncbi:MAG: NAD(P)/FAD-dependent oxidoreductase [Oscillospiraceae bacterium]|jgi:glycerol-3-phosphate dehydrogenase|nr:NAD(P)/FAD-dependent oxidoreductase [Oscillospiraceae bacterium]MCI9309346.1 NAD(P)/FAD-dependent oxidoreductase [Oscillospiraceae bacterium]MCI9548210.1 NAD(P)/FAD-dependent oxidoreductase [Oscillospiraceae bacterium]
MWDAIIIGAGISGCSVARELARYQLKVLVLEKGHDVCAGTTKGNSATVHAGYDPDPGSNKAIYNVRGSRMYPELCRELQVPYLKNGLVMIALDEEQMEEVRKLHEMGQRNGVRTEVCDRARILEIEPDMGEGVIGGLWVPDSGMVCPYNLVMALAENSARNGVEFRTSTQALSVERDGGEWLVSTPDETFRTKYVFNCAGTHADRFNNMVSADVFHIIPREGQHLIMDRDFAPYVKTTIYPTPELLPGGGHTKGMGLMPSVDGTLILGCNADDVDDPDFSANTREGIDKILDFFEARWKYMPISKHVPKFPRDAVITAYGGSRAHPDRDDFILGEPKDAPNFINLAGIESPGVTAAPAIAIDMVKILVDRERPALKQDYKPGREIKKPFRTMTAEERREAIKADPDYARIVCRCEQVTEAEIRDAIRRPVGARSVSAVKMRTRAGMGRCQGGFCSPRVLEILCEELGLDPLEVTQSGGRSNILVGRACEPKEGEA